jgi:peptidoglycan-N-acetylmuramic acid deacetylase
MKLRKITVSVIGVFIILSIFSMVAINKEGSEKSIATSAEATLSNKKIGWGIRRGVEHSQPDLGKSNKQLIDNYEGIAMGNPEKKYVYLTFDEGYEAGLSSDILDILKKTNVPAAFFITGHYVNSQPDLIKRMIKEGHVIGNHTVNHYSIPSLEEEKLKEEIMKLHKSVYDKFGYEMKYFRPPMGEYSERALSVIKNLGYTTVMWSFAYDDWNVNNQRKTRICKS